MKNTEVLSCGRDMVERTRDGRLSTLMENKKLRLKDSMKNLVSISIDHSTSDLDYQ